MELQFSSLQLLYCSFLFLLVLLKLRKNSTDDKVGACLLPPGPRKLPLIGDIHRLLGSRLPHVAFRDMSNKYGPLMHLKLGHTTTIVVSSSDVAKEVMKTHDLVFAFRPELLVMKTIAYGMTDIAFAPYGEYWRQLRKICTVELLSVRRVQSFRSLRQEEMLILARRIASGGAGSPVNLTERVVSAAYGFTSRASFGLNTRNQELFLVLMHEVIRLASGFQIADLYPDTKWLHVMSGAKSELLNLHRQLDEILEIIINDHKLNKSTGDGSQREDDLVDVLLRFQEDGNNEIPLTNDNIKAVIIDIFTGGSETSATTVIWAMAEMLKNPRVLKKGQDEVRRVFKDEGYVDETRFHQLNYLKSIIKETLRLHPVLPLLLPRECRKTCKINGYEIPAKARIMVNAWAIARDPEHWDDAESFIPERFLESSIDFKGNYFEYIPFGAGRRMCPGMSFANANVEIQLATLLYHFDWSLPEGMKPEDLPMTERMGATVSRKDNLMVIPTVKIPLPIQ